jgi:acyl dehydratase
VGRFCGSNTYAITPEVVRFYADALDDRSPAWSKVAPPLLHHSECYKFVGEWYLKNLFGNLHAQQDWEMFGPIAVGSKVRSVSTIVDRYTKRGRLYVVNETDLFDATSHRLLVRSRTHQSFLPDQQTGALSDEPAGDGKSAFVVDEKTAARKSPRLPFPTATGPDLATVEKTVDERRCWMFSGPGRNYHTDREQARKLGFPNIVVQGMMTTCFVSQVMHDAFGGGWLRGGRMSVKLTNVLWVDEHVVAHGKVRETVPEGQAERVHCDVWVEKDDGSRVALGTASAIRG